MKGIARYRECLLACLLVLSSSVPALAQQDPGAAPAAVSGESPTPPPPRPSAPPPLPPISTPPGYAPAQPATPPPSQPAAAGSASGSASISTRRPIDTELPPIATLRDAPELTDPELDEALRWRAQNTWLGPIGGLRVVDGTSGPAGTLRLQFAFDYFSDDEYLYSFDHNEWLGGVLSLAVTPIEHLEVFGSLSTHANSNDAGDPVLLQVAGDVVLGVKGFTQVLPWLGVGGDLRFLFLNTIGDLGVIFKGTSVGFRGLATAALRRTEEALPIVFRANFEYLLDNSSALVDGVEQARYDTLSGARPIDNEDRHLVNRIERFALGINRVDMLTFALGVEAPLEVATDFYIQPLLEWRLGIPVNRQGYSCLSVATSAGPDGADSCLAIEGLSAAPSTLSLGARVLPPVRGLSAMLAFDIGVMGTSTFVRELAPNRPWAVLFAVGYAIDARTPKPQIQYVSAPAAPVALEKTRVRGTVVERGFGTPIVGAIVRYPDTDLSPQLTNADGRFVSYPFDPGDVTIELSHPDYDSGRCSAKVPPRRATPQPFATDGLQPYAAAQPSSGLAPQPARPGAPTPPPAAAPGTLIDIRCELTAHPRGAIRGTVQDEHGAPVAGVSVDITGPTSQSAVTDGAGAFTLIGLPPGDYVARVDSPAHLLKQQPFSVSAGSEASLALVLTAKPRDAAVTLTAKEVKIRNQIMFKTGSAEIDERSSPLLSEIADVLLRNPQAAHVQVQGHTDNVGDPEANLSLSQQRADAVVQWLVSAGVASDRLEAKGFGDSRPLVPNLTDGNRARNRRVQFIVKDQPTPTPP